MEKTFCVIKREDMCKVFVVRINEHSSFKIIREFNSISSTYMGTSIDGFIDAIKLLINRVPGFFESFDEDDPEGSLLRAGFTKMEPSKGELLIYNR